MRKIRCKATHVARLLSELSRLPGGRATTESVLARPNLRSPVEPSSMKRQMNETERRNLMRNMRFCWNYIWRRHVVIPCVRSLLVVWSTLLDFGGSKFRVFVRLWIHDPGRGYCWGNIVRLSENQATHDFGVSKPYFFPARRGGTRPCATTTTTTTTTFDDDTSTTSMSMTQFLPINRVRSAAFTN